MNKKAISGMPMIVIGLILAVITMLILFGIFKGPAVFTKTTFQGEVFSQQLRLCAVQGKQAEVLSPDRLPPDKDNDGYPDPCDFCINGDDGKDVKPFDNFPDDCQDPTKVVKSGDDMQKVCEESPRYKSWDDTKKVCILREEKKSA